MRLPFGTCLAIVSTIAALAVAGSARAATALQPGFQENVVISGLTHPTQIEFAGDGRVFVAEKSGLIKVYDDVNDTTPTTFADLRTKVHNFWDRGMLGLALAPNFPTDPYVYVLYAHDAAIGGTAPRWGTVGGTSDGCPTPPGATDDGCVISGRLSRLQASGNVMTGSEQVLIEDWCQQYPSHSVGDLAFGPDGALYVSGGDGASFGFVDYGQVGDPCGDPPVGGGHTPPTAEGGALRSIDLRTSGDPVGLDGTILRVNPATGAGMPDNPLASSSDLNARRIVAQGLRNPFRFTMRPGTDEVWLGDVGWGSTEEINVVTDPSDGSVDNFGWPCHEGDIRQDAYEAANLNMCNSLYAAGGVTQPYFDYDHSNNPVVAGEPSGCLAGSSSISGLEFYKIGTFPDSYDWGLFFSDYSRKCIWAMLNSDDLPSPTQVVGFAGGAAGPVDLEAKGGDLYYAGFDDGTIRRISYGGPTNQPPTAVATANPTTGAAPLAVQFNGAGSSDPNPGDTLDYAWDLDGDGQFDDSNAVNPTRTYAAGTHTITLRVTDDANATDTDSVTVTAGGNTPPQATITAPSASLLWQVGQQVGFNATATDTQDGSLAASRFSWQLDLNHCPSTCHVHPLQTYPGIKSGSFVAPDHEYPSTLTLRLTVTDSGGLTDTEQVMLNPSTVALTFRTSSPTGLKLTHNATTATTQFTRTVIRGSNNTISAPSPQVKGGKTYAFRFWSDGGAQTHNITAGGSATFTATFRRISGAGASAVCAKKAKKGKKKKKKKRC